MEKEKYKDFENLKTQSISLWRFHLRLYTEGQSQNLLRKRPIRKRWTQLRSFKINLYRLQTFSTAESDFSGQNTNQKNTKTTMKKISVKMRIQKQHTSRVNGYKNCPFYNQHQVPRQKIKRDGHNRQNTLRPNQTRYQRQTSQWRDHIELRN